MTSCRRLELVSPNRALRKSFLRYASEMADDGDDKYIEAAQNFDSYIETLREFEQGVGLKEGQVPYSFYFSVRGSCIVGTLRIRHRLTEALCRNGGHIGFDVLPSDRRRGYGTEMLQLAIPKCRLLDIKVALITCRKTNIGSIRIIMTNGGILRSCHLIDEKEMLVFELLTDG